MWTDTTEGREFIRAISQDIVRQVAPEELDLFDELVTEYFQDPSPPDLAGAVEDDPLGFGFNESLVAVAPAAAAMTSAVLGHLINVSITTVIKEESGEAVKKKIKAMLNREKKAGESEAPGSKEVPPLTREQMEQVYQLAINQAVKFGVEPDLAEKMSGALIGSLALAK